MVDNLRCYQGTDSRLHTEVGEVQGCSMRSTGKSGFLLFGPYESFGPGDYLVAIRFNSNNCNENCFVDISCDTGRTQLYIRNLHQYQKGSWNEMLAFSISERKDIEVRVWVDDDADLGVEHVEVRNINHTYANNFAVVCKSYHKDVEWAVLLYSSWIKYSSRQCPFYLIIPKSDYFLFSQRFECLPKEACNNLTLIAEEDVLQVAHINLPINYDGWRAQQIIKLCFSKTNFSKHYLTLDSAMLFTKKFDFFDLYSDDKVLCTAAKYAKKIDVYKFLNDVSEVGWLNNKLVNLSQSFEAISDFFDNVSEDTHWYIGGNGFFDSDLCKELEDFAYHKGVDGFFGIIEYAPYEFFWYGEYVFTKQRDKFRPKGPELMATCQSITSLNDIKIGALTVPENLYGFLFQPPASDFVELVEAILNERGLI
ncbi:DUF6492 family protein [Acidithiobacillus thiooxidans]|uniref:DUF6492 family protein n=1 Tax=Acidithiobacillus thiooxidans TaxID=930 RepID=UPI00285F2388|nr:DUF6492 family protein [Acidithiobacillus thiooxidans]MDR7927331.1 DUF6492 family protein [Acidithiobacillus thiooxidans]